MVNEWNNERKKKYYIYIFTAWLLVDMLNGVRGTDYDHVRYQAILISWVILNSLAPGKCGSNFKCQVLEQILWIKFMNTSYEIALRQMLQNLTNERSTLAQVMAWCHEATSHCMSQCWPRSMSPYSITKQSGTEQNLVAKILAANFGVFFVI